MPRLFTFASILLATAALAQTPPRGNNAYRQPIPSPAAQAIPSLAPPPATALEAFGTRTNSVIARGYTDVAGLRDDDGAALRVLAVEFKDLTTSEKAQGLAIEVHQARADAPTVVSLVDEDEIDGLIDGVETLAKLESNTSALANYDARFRTRGALELANVNVNATRRLTLTATQILPANGQLVWGTMSLPLSRAKELQNQLTQAKEALVRTRPQPAPPQD